MPYILKEFAFEIEQVQCRLRSPRRTKLKHQNYAYGEVRSNSFGFKMYMLLEPSHAEEFYAF
ncbi:hypothetical protein F8388_023902 [Cannabis sativa]|nr:hypothetical protein F8388_023902 [Cannabis sativa]KAF4399266.1 hypothetical protein G4B88_022349 [Cannabis sativa]